MLQKNKFCLIYFAMSCFICKSPCLDLVNHLVQYEMEPLIEEIVFEDRVFRHDHDFNERISIWKCSNNHEFKRSGRKPCLGCLEQRQYESHLQRIKPVQNNSDSCPLIFSNSFEPPPAIM